MFSSLHARLKQAQRGFTLLELLVVISIIGILIGLTAVSYTTAQKKGRDARRLGDLKGIQAVYEQYYSNPENNYSYPATCDASEITPYAPGGWPVDPRDNEDDGYVYTKNCTTSTYCFCGLLEGGVGNSSDEADANCTGIGSAGDYFCVKNQQ